MVRTTLSIKERIRLEITYEYLGTGKSLVRQTPSVHIILVSSYVLPLLLPLHQRLIYHQPLIVEQTDLVDVSTLLVGTVSVHSEVYTPVSVEVKADVSVFSSVLVLVRVTVLAGRVVSMML